MAGSSPLHDFQGSSTLSAVPQEMVHAGEGLLVLTRDDALVDTLQVIGSEHDVFTVGSESDLAAHLLAEHTGVAILDAAAIATPVERLTERLKAQFPDLVLIVAGGVDDQSALATQITNGTVYRFLHKPVSEQRVRLFVDAAWRRHDETHSGDSLFANTMPAGKRTGVGSNTLLLAGVGIAALALLAVWLLLGKPETSPPASNPGAAEASLPAPVRDAVLEGLLERADRALQSGVLVAPPGENAAELYLHAMRHNANDPRAANGLEKVIDRLLSGAEAQLLAQHLEEAQKLTEQARTIKPDHVRVAFLTAQIGKERERAALTQARQAASSGHIEQALTMLEGASHDGRRSTLVTEARQELEQKKSDERVRDYLSSASDRMRRGLLLEPAQDDAQFFIEAARALAPDDSDVRQIQRQFLDRLVTEAGKALAAGNADQGEHWIQAAADSGVDRNDIAALTREAQRVRTAAKADALARLALLFNQRLTQGKLLEPASDNAKFYLAQLMQADPTHASAQLAQEAFAARSLDEAKNAVRRQDYAGAQRWLTEAHDAGGDQTNINAVNNDIKTAQDAPKRANEFVTASSLELTHYVPPVFPSTARQRSMSGWVDMQFLVRTDGSVTDIGVIGADPVGMFEKAATEAVHKWRYRPVMRDGRPIDQRARLRVRFTLQQ
ncbi:MAG: Protein TonB [Gammaproteobacteria bacterium]|nr:Protein TonB [Gammaproteobacteria bacterium]